MTTNSRLANLNAQHNAGVSKVELSDIKAEFPADKSSQVKKNGHGGKSNANGQPSKKSAQVSTDIYTSEAHSPVIPGVNGGQNQYDTQNNSQFITNLSSRPLMLNGNETVIIENPDGSRLQAYTGQEQDKLTDDQQAKQQDSDQSNQIEEEEQEPEIVYRKLQKQAPQNLGYNSHAHNIWKQRFKAALKNKGNQQVFQPNIASILYIDIFVLVLVFFLTLVSNFSRKSIHFNITMTVIFFLKAILGVRYRLVRQFLALRSLLVQRLLFDIGIILPLVIVFRIKTNTSPLNFVVVLLVLTLSELVILFWYSRYLYQKRTIESIESLQATGVKVNLQGFKQKPLSMWYFNKKLKTYVMQVNTKSVAEHIVNTLGIPFNPKEYHRLTRHYSYLKPNNPEQIKEFNKNRIEFRDDRQKKMMLNSGQASASAAERFKFLKMTEMERELPSESCDIHGNWNAFLGEKSQRVLERSVDHISSDIGKFVKMKQISGAREDQWDIGWFHKSNEILNIDFEEEEDRNNLKLSDLLDDSRMIQENQNKQQLERQAQRSPEHLNAMNNQQNVGENPGFPILVDLNCRQTKKDRQVMLIGSTLERLMDEK